MMKRPLRHGVRLTLEVGRRYVTRNGTKAKLVYIHPQTWKYLVCVTISPQPEKFSLCPDGRYFPRDEDHGLDLMREMAVA